MSWEGRCAHWPRQDAFLQPSRGLQSEAHVSRVPWLIPPQALIVSTCHRPEAGYARPLGAIGRGIEDRPKLRRACPLLLTGRPCGLEKVAGYLRIRRLDRAGMFIPRCPFHHGVINNSRTIELLLLHELPTVIRNSAGMVSVTVPIVARVLIVAMKLFGFWLVAYMVLSFPVARMTMFTEVSLGSSGNPALSCL